MRHHRSRSMDRQAWACTWSGLLAGLAGLGGALLLALTLSMALLRPAQAAPDLSWLSAEERAWLAAHPVVRMGVDPGYAPYAFVDEHGQAQGVSADTIKLLAPMLGLRFELVRLPTWAAIMDAVRAQQIDLVTTVSHLPERDAFLAFSSLYIHTPLVVMTRQDTPSFNSPDAIADLRVALVEGYSSSQRVLARYPGLRPMMVKDAVDGLAAVADGRADAYVGVLGVNLYQAQKFGLSNLKVNLGFDLRENGQNLAVRKDWAPLARIFSKALDRIPETEKLAILNRWLPPLRPLALSPRPTWTEAESSWLAQARVVRVGYENKQSPFSFSDGGGQPAGLLVDMLRNIQQQAGLQLQWVAGDAESLLRHWRAGEIDLLLQQGNLTQREPGLLATQALYQSSYLLVCRRSDDCSQGLADFDGRAVAVRRGSAAHDQALRRPHLRLVTTDDMTQALRLLHDNQVDAVMGEARSMLRAYEQAQPPVSGLQFGGTFGDGTVRLQMAVRSDWPELVTVLNRSMDALPPEQVSQLRSQWLGAVPPPSGLNPRLVLRYALVAAAAALLLFGLQAWVNRRLRHEVALRRETERELALARDRAEAASRHKSEFVAATSHELRTPLNAIVGMRHLLEHTPLSAVQARYLAIQSTATQGLLALVNDLLDIARIEAGHLVLRPQPTALMPLLEDCLHIVQEQASAKELRLALQAGPELPPSVLVDPDRLKQVLVNLLANAVKYTPSGAVTLLASSLPGAATGQLWLRLAVNDTGPGIAQQHRQRLFQPFHQAGATSTEAAQGVGLGLSIASQLVQRMGGELALDSAPGQGCSFHFQLALDSDAETPIEPHTKPPASSAQVTAVDGDATDTELARRG